jgi:hypothetical protein
MNALRPALTPADPAWWIVLAVLAAALLVLGYLNYRARTRDTCTGPGHHWHPVGRISARTDWACCWCHRYYRDGIPANETDQHYDYEMYPESPRGG